MTNSRSPASSSSLHQAETEMHGYMSCLMMTAGVLRQWPRQHSNPQPAQQQHQPSPSVPKIRSSRPVNKVRVAQQEHLPTTACAGPCLLCQMQSHL